MLTDEQQLKMYVMVESIHGTLHGQGNNAGLVERVDNIEIGNAVLEEKTKRKATVVSTIAAGVGVVINIILNTFGVKFGG